MKLFEIYNKLSEAKQVGLLYHAMDKDKLDNMLRYDSLGDRNSFSRNKMYDYVVGRDKEYIYQLELDGDKLSNKYKIRPRNDGQGWVYDEYEEYIKDKITNVGKYITKIIIIQQKWYYWLTKGYKKGTYNKIYGSYNDGIRFNELSYLLSTYLKKYPHIELKLKEKHGGKILDIGEKELKFLRSMGLSNPAEEKYHESVVGLYKDKKLIERDLDNLDKYIENNLDKIFITIDEDPGTKMSAEEYLNQFPKKDRKRELYTFLSPPEDTLVDINNNYVIIELLRNKSNTFYFQILGNKNTKKDVPFYRKLIRKYSKKEIQFVDVPKSYEKMYSSFNDT